MSWVELATVQYSDGTPELTGSGRFRQVDAEAELVVAPIAEHIEGHWGFRFRDSEAVLADYPTEQDARAALADAVSVCTFTVQGTESTPAAKSAATRKRAGSS